MLVLMISTVIVPGNASAKTETLPSYDYMILGDAVYKSSKTSTLASELSTTQKGKKVNETFSDKTETRMVNNWVKYGHDINQATGFKASSYYNPYRNEIVIAFAGTNDIMDWVNPRMYKTYATLLTAAAHKQREQAQEYASLVANGIGKNTYIHPKDKKRKTINSNAKIVMTGHSLGGYLVQVSGVRLIRDSKLNGTFKAGYTFNALGLAKVDIPYQWAERNASKYNKFVHFGTTPELVGMYNESTKRILIGSSKNKITTYVKEISPSTGIIGLHLYSALYRHYNWE